MPISDCETRAIRRLKSRAGPTPSLGKPPRAVTCSCISNTRTKAKAPSSPRCSWNACSGRDEVDHLILRPIAVVLGRRRPHEPAVAAVFAEAQVDVRIAGDARIAKRVWRDERIVLGRDHERRQPNPIDDAHGARALVVVFGPSKAEVRSRVGFFAGPYSPKW